MWIQNKVDESKHDIHSQVDAITAGTASVVNLTAGNNSNDFAYINIYAFGICIKTLCLLK